MNPRVTIDCEPDGHHMAGSLTVGDQPPHAFSGWLELLSLLQVALVPGDDDTTPTTPREEP